MRKVPKLRFKEFTDEWEEKKLGEISEIYDGIHQTPNYVEKGIKFVSVEDIKDIENTNKFITEEDFEKGFKIKPQKDDILMTRITAGVIGATYIVKNNYPLAYYVSLALIRKKEKIDVNFLSQNINSKYFKKELNKRIIHVAFPKKINLGDIGECTIKITKLQEQEKIDNFLTSVDKKISLTEEKLELFREYKKGVMQKIFSQELRFKDGNGNDYPEWEEKKLGEVFERIIEKNVENNTNVLTISAQYGLISQVDFFNKSVAGKDLSKYYLLQKGDFAYNKSYSNGYPMGAIKKLKFYEKGIVSTLYICFRLKNKKYSTNYFEQYFESKKIDKNIQEIAQEGARNHGLLNISVQDFFNIYIPFPLLEEQQKIADFLSSIDSKIENIEKELEGLKEFKKGLLQQMFV